MPGAATAFVGTQPLSSCERYRTYSTRLTPLFDPQRAASRDLSLGAALPSVDAEVVRILSGQAATGRGGDVTQVVFGTKAASLAGKVVGGMLVGFLLFAALIAFIIFTVTSASAGNVVEKYQTIFPDEYKEIETLTRDAYNKIKEKGNDESLIINLNEKTFDELGGTKRSLVLACAILISDDEEKTTKVVSESLKDSFLESEFDADEQLAAEAAAEIVKTFKKEEILQEVFGDAFGNKE